MEKAKESTKVREEAEGRESVRSILHWVRGGGNSSDESGKLFEKDWVQANHI